MRGYRAITTGKEVRPQRLRYDLYYVVGERTDHKV
jgi:hypothetical protein